MTSLGKEGPPPESETEVRADPDPWEITYPKAVKEILEWFKTRGERKLSKDLLEQKRLALAYRLLRRGILTKKFIEDEFFKEFFGPFLSDEKDLKPWRPGDSPDHNAIVTTHIFASGKAIFAQHVLDTFKKWIEVGDNARKAIDEDNARRKAIKELRG